LLKPIKNNVIVELIEKEKVTSTGIVLSSADPLEANKGKVLKIGPDVLDVKEGDMILPNWNKARLAKYMATDFYIVSEDDVVLIFEE
jgi:co-chaperonin GroES (HSP10)